VVEEVITELTGAANELAITARKKAQSSDLQRITKRVERAATDLESAFGEACL
jgi:histone H3/H4